MFHPRLARATATKCEAPTRDRAYEVEVDCQPTDDARTYHMYSRPAIFLDRDGVLVEDVDLLSEPDQVRLEVDVPDALRPSTMRALS